MGCVRGRGGKAGCATMTHSSGTRPSKTMLNTAAATQQQRRPLILSSCQTPTVTVIRIPAHIQTSLPRACVALTSSNSTASSFCRLFLRHVSCSTATASCSVNTALRTCTCSNCTLACSTQQPSPHHCREWWEFVERSVTCRECERHEKRAGDGRVEGEGRCWRECVAVQSGEWWREVGGRDGFCADLSVMSLCADWLCGV